MHPPALRQLVQFFVRRKFEMRPLRRLAINVALIDLTILPNFVIIRAVGRW
jgi:hypothetical protein